MAKKLHTYWALHILIFFIGGMASQSGFSQQLTSGVKLWGEPNIQLAKNDGLSDLYIKDYLEDENGFMWIGSYTALTRFDGFDLKQFQLDSIGNLQVVALAEDKKNKHLFVGCLNGVYQLDLVTYKTEMILDIENFANWNSGHILCMRVDHNDRLWMGTTEGYAIYDLKSKAIKIGSIPMAKNIELRPKHIHSILADPNQKDLFWLGTEWGLVKYNEGTNESVIYGPNDPKIKFKRESLHIHYNSDHHSIVLTSDVRIGRQLDFQFLIFDMKTESFKNKILLNSEWRTRGIFTKNKDELWLSTDQGVGIYNWESDLLETIISSRPNEVNPVRIDFVDSSKRIWSTGKNTINVYGKPDSPIAHFAYETNFPKGYHVCTDLYARDQKVYMSVYGGDGVYCFDLKKEEWKILIDEANEEKKMMLGVSFETMKDGRILALCNNESFTIENGELIPFRPGGRKLHFGDGLIDEKGYLYGHFTGRIVKINLESGEEEEILTSFENCDTKSGFFEGFMDRYNNLWFLGICNGFILYRSQDKQFIHSRNLGLDSRLNTNIVDVEVQNEQAYVITETGILAIFDLNELIYKEVFDLSKMLENPIGMVVTNSVFDKKGVLWVLTSVGLLRFDHKKQTVKLFDEDDGIEIKDKELGVFSAEQIINVGENFIVYSTRKEIHVVNTENLQTGVTTPKPFVRSFLVNNSKFSTDTIARFKKKYVLKPTENYLTFEFSAIDFDYPNLTHFAHKLEGVDENWVESSRRNVTYAYLPGGDYSLMLKAKRGDGEWSPTSYIDIEIQKKWYQTLLIQGLAIILFGGFVYAVYKSRIRSAVEKQKIKSDFERKLAEVKMNALTAQMNPHFIFNSLNSIDYFIIKNDRMKASEYLNRFARLIRLILSHSRSNYITLRDDLEALKLYIEIECMRFNEQFDYVVQAGHNVDLDTIQIPPLLLQPYVENAIWHGLMHKTEKGCLQVNVEMDEKNESIIATIEDNGVGRKKAAEMKSKMVKQKAQKSMGMSITKDKLEIINFLHNLNATSKIEDVFNENGEVAGTRVTLQIPV